MIEIFVGVGLFMTACYAIIVREDRPTELTPVQQVEREVLRIRDTVSSAEAEIHRLSHEALEDIVAEVQRVRSERGGFDASA